MKKLNFLLYDYASYLMYIAYAAGSVIFPVVIKDIAAELGFPLDSGGMGAAGALHAVRCTAMLVSMLLCGFSAARFGLRESILPGFVLMLLAVGSAVVVPNYACLMVIMVFAGFGEGTIEGLGTPFVQELHRDEEPGRYVNFSHGFWSVGVALATVGAGVMLYFDVPWQSAVLCIALGGMPGVLLLLSGKDNARLLHARGQKAGEVLHNTMKILRNPRFWWYVAAIIFAAGAEWCLTFWTPTFIRNVHGGGALLGGVAMAVFACGMMLGRMLSGVLIPERKLPQMLIVTGVLTAVPGIILPFAGNLVLIFVLVFLCGTGIGPWWPSIQNVCVQELSEYDSTMIYILLSCAGIPGCGGFTWLQGVVADIPVVGLRWSFLLMPLAGIIMTVLLATVLKKRLRENN